MRCIAVGRAGSYWTWQTTVRLRASLRIIVRLAPSYEYRGEIRTWGGVFPVAGRGRGRPLCGFGPVYQKI